MARVMRTYHERWRFRHPRSEDFYDVVAEVAGPHRRAYFERTVERPGVLDDEVASVKSEQVREPRGVFGEGEKKATVTTKEARRKEEKADEAGGRPWRTTVVVRRRGELSLPTSLRLEYEGGKAQTVALREHEPGGSELETASLAGSPGGGGAVERPVEAPGAHRRAPSRLGHPRSRGPAGPRREPPQQLPARRAGRARRRALGRALGVLAAAASRRGGALAMILAATREGLGALRRAPRLAVVLWLVNLALALAAGVPGFLALRSAIGLLPGADALGDGFSLGVLVDLLELRPGLLGGLFLSALGVAGLGLLAGAAATGGALEVLMSRDDRPFAHRFGRGAGRFFARFLRAGLLASLAGALAAALLAGPLLAVGGRMRRESGQEALALFVSLGGVAVAALVVVLSLLALDAARIRIVREDARRVLPLLRSGFAVVLGHPVKWLGTWGLNALLVALALALYVAFRNAVPAGTLPLVLLMVVAQQAFVLARSGLRVALLGSEIALLDRLRPIPPAPAPPAPEPDQPLAEPEPPPLP